MEQIKYQIEVGVWPPGGRLPTVREMAQGLRINYNTVRAAYQELERQGYIITEQGRGTFVSKQPPVREADQEAKLLELIDEALAKAQALDIPAEMFARTAYARAKLAAPVEGEPLRLLFVECNWADIEYYAQTIKTGTGVSPEIFLVDDLKGREPAFFDQFDLLVTTLFHIDELQEVAGPERPMLGLMIEPSYFEVLAEISHLPRGTKVGLVCASQAGAEQMSRALNGVGANYLEYHLAGADQPEKLAQVFEEAEVVYVSRLAQSQRRQPWPGTAPARIYVDDIDPAALRLLRREINRLRAAKHQLTISN
jgi:GntR family transcriptional regulator